MTLRILLRQLIFIGLLLGFCLWIYWGLIWQQLTIYHFHFVSRGPYYGLGIRLEILVFVFIISLLVYFLTALSDRYMPYYLVRTIIAAIGIAVSAVVINEGLFTNRSLTFKVSFYLVGSILSLEAGVLSSLSRGTYVTFPATARVPAGIYD